MSLKIIWRRRAQHDLIRVIDYIAARSPSAADKMGDAFQKTVERLADYPYLYRSGRVPGTREAVVHPNYILIYTVERDSVLVLRIVHARQQYP